MKKLLLVTVVVLLNACSLPNANPHSRTVHCPDFTSKDLGEEKSVSITTTSGKKLDIVAFGSARNPAKINLHYGRGCYIDLVRDVRRIEKNEDNIHKVILNNGNSIEVGKYNSQWGQEPSRTPYNISPWSVIVETTSGEVDYYSEVIYPFENLSTLTVINKPVKLSSLNSFYKLKLREQEAYDLLKKANEEAKRREQAERKMAEREKRDFAKKSISKSENIGSKICKNGTLKYFAKHYYKPVSEEGQIIGYLEGFSQDGYRVKFRVFNFATESGKLRFDISGAPKLDGFSAQPGVIYWDDVKDWFLCGL